MKFDNIENKCHKIVDGGEIWDSRSIAVVGMILMKHEEDIYVILGKRGPACPDEVGKYCMICGYLDKNETCEEAVLRETYEETGLNLNNLVNKYTVIYNHLHFPWRINSTPDTPLQNVSMHYAVYLKTEKGMDGELGELPKFNVDNNVNSLEVEKLEWINIEDLHNYDLAFGHDKIINVFVNSLPNFISE